MQDKPLYKREWIQLGVLLVLFAAATAFVQIEKGVAINEIDWNLVITATFFAAMRTLGKSWQDQAKIMRGQMPQPQAYPVGAAPSGYVGELHDGSRVYGPPTTPRPPPPASHSAPAPAYPPPAAPHGAAGLVLPVPGIPTDVEMGDEQRRAEIKRLQDQQARIDGRVAEKVDGAEDRRIVGRDGA